MYKDEIEFYNPDTSLLIFLYNSFQFFWIFIYIYKLITTLVSETENLAEVQGGFSCSCIWGGWDVRTSGTAFWTASAGFSGLSCFCFSTYRSFFFTNQLLHVARHSANLSDLYLGHFPRLSLSSGHTHLFHFRLPTSGPLPATLLPMPFAWLTPSHPSRSQFRSPPTQKDPPRQPPLPSHCLSEHAGDLHRTEGNRKRLSLFPSGITILLSFMRTGTSSLSLTTAAPVPRTETGTQ